MDRFTEFESYNILFATVVIKDDFSSRHLVPSHFRFAYVLWLRIVFPNVVFRSLSLEHPLVPLFYFILLQIFEHKKIKMKELLSIFTIIDLWSFLSNDIANTTNIKPLS